MNKAWERWVAEYEEAGKKEKKEIDMEKDRKMVIREEKNVI